MHRTTVDAVRVHRAPLCHARGLLVAGNLRLPCALGRSGVTRAKREGDGASPAGWLAVRRIWWRADRVPPPRGRVPRRRIRPDLGWCDDARHRRYNQPIPLPTAAGHELMWREDRLYDYVVELGWNDRPAKPGRGSAIFLHLARPGLSPTAGCVAVTPAAIRPLLARLGPRTRLVIA
jgi:L,D-peptidoglycan transpeptidase YkuD (ErfK/YbiS/YcfS/YnhG family)